MPTALRYLLLALAVCTAAAADTLAPGGEGPLAVPGCTYPCVLYVPSDYVAGTPTPLIMFMHGSGGKPTTWPFKDATGGKGYLIVGLSYGGLAGAGAQGIQGDPASCTAMIAFIAKVRDQIAATYSVDQQRVVLSGLSMGGWGVNMYGFKPEAKGRFCGYAIIAAGAEPAQGDLSVARGLPVLVLNGQTDPNLPTANKGMPALEQAGAIATQVVLPGEGHVPGNAAIGPPIASWLAGLAAAAARNRALVAVAWTRAELAGAQEKGGDAKAALAHLLSAQPWLAAADPAKPVLIFVRSGLQAADGTLAAPARDSAAVEESVFAYPAAGGVPAASRHVTCFDLDVAKLDAKTHPLLNLGSAPTVILLAKDRSVAAVLKGRAKITEAAVLGELRKLLDPEANAAVDARIAETAPVLKELQAVRKQQAAKQEALAKLRQLPAKDDATRTAKAERIAQETKAMAEIDARYEALRDRLMPKP